MIRMRLRRVNLFVMHSSNVKYNRTYKFAYCFVIDNMIIYFLEKIEEYFELHP